MCGRVRFFAQWERVTAAVAAPLRFLLSVCVSRFVGKRRAERISEVFTPGKKIVSARKCARRHSLPTRPNQQGREHDRPQARFAAPRSYAEHVRAACATSAEVSFSARDTIQRLRDGRHQTLGAECGGVTPVPTCRRHQSCLCCIMLHSVGLRSLLRTACCGL
jgi:hypothetical protein